MEAFVAKPDEANQHPHAEDLFKGFEVKQVGVGSISQWLKKGWNDLLNNPIPSLIYGIIFAIVGIAMSFIAVKNPVFSVATTTGFLLVSPFLALGLYDLSRQAEQGQKPDFMKSATSMSANLVSIGIYAIVLGMLMIFWVRLAAVVTAIFFNNVVLDQQSFVGMWQGFLNMPQGLEFLLAFFAVGFLFAAAAFITGVVTCQLLLDRKVDIVTAIVTSIKVVAKNPVPMAIWALTLTLLTGLGLITYNLGLIVIMPILAHASWHAYRELVQTSPA